MLNCDMAGVIAAMRGTPKRRTKLTPHVAPVSVKQVFRTVSIPQMSTEDSHAWDEYFSRITDLNDWRDAW